MLEVMTVDLIHSNSDRAICTTSPVGFWGMNLYENLAKRGVIYELFPTQVASFENNETINFSIKNIKRVNPEQIALMKDLGMDKLYFIYSDLLEMNESPTIQKELFNQLLEKFPINSLIENFSPEVLASFSEAAASINPEMNTKFKEEYAERALDLIKKVNINAATIKKDAIELQHVVRIYTDANWQLVPKKTSKFSKSEKQVLTQLKKKLKELSSSQRADNLLWTMEEIEKVQAVMMQVKF